MATTTLWEQFSELEKNYKWVDLSHNISPNTPHWVGFPALKVENMLEIDKSLFCAHIYTTVGQYGTHIDAPSHMVEGGRTLDQITIQEMIMPLCVINCSEAVAQNADYILTVEDIIAFETKYTRIPEGAFVVFQSNWSKRKPETFDNLDESGNRHFPGWSFEALQFLIENRNVRGIGHETSDTEAPITSSQTNYAVEKYLLEMDRIQIELLNHVEQLPPFGAIIFCTFPKVLGGSGFPARCFALCPRN